MVAERCSASMGRLSGKSVEVQVGLSSLLSSQKKKEQELVEAAAVSCYFERRFVNPLHSCSCNYAGAVCVAYYCHALGSDNH